MHTARTPQQIIDQTARLLGTSAAAVRSPTRQEPTITARHLSAYLIRQSFPHMPLLAIAHLVGRTDHSTIIHSLKRVGQLIETGDARVCWALSRLDTVERYEEQMDEIAARVARRALA